MISPGLIGRAQEWAWQVLLWGTQTLALFGAGPLYVLFGGWPVDVDETTSSRVGRAAVAGLWWGLLLERPIDQIAMLLGRAPGHCRRNIEPRYREAKKCPVDA
jgi:hypothetical protein